MDMVANALRMSALLLTAKFGDLTATKIMMETTTLSSGIHMLNHGILSVERRVLRLLLSMKSQLLS